MKTSTGKWLHREVIRRSDVSPTVITVLVLADAPGVSWGERRISVPKRLAQSNFAGTSTLAVASIREMKVDARHL